jgi:hypothetical protein
MRIKLHVTDNGAFTRCEEVPFSCPDRDMSKMDNGCKTSSDKSGSSESSRRDFQIVESTVEVEIRSWHCNGSWRRAASWHGGIN